MTDTLSLGQPRLDTRLSSNQQCFLPTHTTLMIRLHSSFTICRSVLLPLESFLSSISAAAPLFQPHILIPITDLDL